MKNVYFDMDGTLVDLYNVSNVFNLLDNFDVKPYIIAKPIDKTIKLLNVYKQHNYHITIITWLSKVSNTIYDKQVADAKINWLHDHNVYYDDIYVLPYGFNKDDIEHDIINDTLIDDDIKVRSMWHGLTLDPTTI